MVWDNEERGSQSQYPSGTVALIHHTIAMAFAFTIVPRCSAPSYSELYGGLLLNWRDKRLAGGFICAA
jgi:hypothetical protein